MGAEMDTTTAAKQAKVTVETIRTWCRYGAVQAVKVAGRWVIDTASLTYRISLTAKERIVKISADAVIAIGGQRWTRGDKDRVYIDGWARFIGLEISQYNTGNISYAELDGKKISNSEAYRLLGSVYKVYFDIPTSKLVIQWGDSSSRTMDHDDLKNAIFGGIRAEIAAL